MENPLKDRSTEAIVQKHEKCYTVLEHSHKYMKTLSKKLALFVRLGAGIVGAVLIALPATVQAVSAWSPTLLVNTESFQIIDEGDGTTDIEVIFGDTVNEQLEWDVTNNRFNFTDDVHVEGDIQGSGDLIIEDDGQIGDNLTVNADNEGADAVITFGNDAASRTIRLSDTTNLFEFSTGVTVNGNISGASLQITDLLNCDTIDTDSQGNLICGTDEVGSGGEDLYVNIEGDTMTGNLIIANGSGLIASGTIATESGIVINKDNADQDAILVFGNDAGAETLIFNNTNERFEFSDDLHVTNNLSASGTLAITGNATFGNNVTAQGNISGDTLTVSSTGVNIAGVQYDFPTTGGASGQSLQYDANGNLVWANTTVGNGSGGIVSVQPEYPHAVYFASGSSSVGRMRLEYATGSTTNYYRWSTTRTTAQNYWISTQIRVPDNFSSWDPSAPIQFHYRSSGGTLSVRLQDTADAYVPLTGGEALTSTSFTTANITGPETTGTYTAGEYITVYVKMEATRTGGSSTDPEEFADAGFLELNWETTTP